METGGKRGLEMEERPRASILGRSEMGWELESIVENPCGLLESCCGGTRGCEVPLNETSTLNF